MKTIPAAMTWELFDRGRWSFPAAALGALAFPLIILAALTHEGAFVPSDKSILIMHMVLVQMNVVVFGAPLAVGAWRLNRLYAYPATAATLVAWRLLPVMIAMAIETVLWTAALNAIFHLDWPLWGPALFSAVALAAVEATLWLAEKSRWVIVAFIVVGAVLGFWLKSRYGAMFGDPLHQWTTLTPAETLTMIAFGALVYATAVYGAARNRRGEPPFSTGLAAWTERFLDRLFDRDPSASAPFRSPQRAQFWYVWRNGWVAPAIVAGVLLVGFVIWFFVSRDPQDLVVSLFGGAPLLMCAGFITAAIMGNVSQTNDLAMNQFQATRPLSTPDLARTILRAAALSLLFAWAVWVAAVAGIYGTLTALGLEFAAQPSDGTDWRLIPASLVGSWIIAGCLLSAFLTGRSRPMVRLFAALMSLYIGGIVLAKFALTPEAIDQFVRALVVILGVACVLGTIAAFVAARRRGLVESATAWAALAAFSALAIGAVLLLPPHANLPGPAYAFFIGLTSLAVFPLAAAPLALAWNRHR